MNNFYLALCTTEHGINYWRVTTDPDVLNRYHIQHVIGPVEADAETTPTFEEDGYVDSDLLEQLRELGEAEIEADRLYIDDLTWVIQTRVETSGGRKFRYDASLDMYELAEWTGWFSVEPLREPWRLTWSDAPYALVCDSPQALSTHLWGLEHNMSVRDALMDYEYFTDLVPNVLAFHREDCHQE